jgi:ABC-2 type transport system permease protein
MTNSVIAEILVLRKRASTWVLLSTWTALALFFSYVLPYVEQRSMTELLPEGLAGTLVRGFPFFGGVFALMLGVLAVGSDYSWDTMKTLLTQRPSRLRMLTAKLMALGIVLVLFVASVAVTATVASYVVASVENAAVDWPSAWLLVRTFAAGWFVLVVWAALGVMLAVLSRGTSLAIGIGILYALVIEGLLSALVTQLEVLDGLSEFFLRTNSYSIASALGASTETIADSGPGAFAGPYVSSGQAAAVLAAYAICFVVAAAVALRRRDVA